jgi:hypothetical protein
MLYIDPSAGSVALQIAVAAIVGGAVTVKRWWGSLTHVVRSGLRRNHPR